MTNIAEQFLIFFDLCYSIEKKQFGKIAPQEADNTLFKLVSILLSWSPLSPDIQDSDKMCENISYKLKNVTCAENHFVIDYICDIFKNARIYQIERQKNIFVISVLIYIIFYVKKLVSTSCKTFFLLHQEEFLKLPEQTPYFSNYQEHFRKMADYLDIISLVATEESLSLNILFSKHIISASIPMEKFLSHFKPLFNNNIFFELTDYAKQEQGYHNPTECFKETAIDDKQIMWTIISLRASFLGRKSFYDADAPEDSPSQPTSIGQAVKIQTPNQILYRTLTTLQYSKNQNFDAQSHFYISEFLIHSFIAPKDLNNFQDPLIMFTNFGAHKTVKNAALKFYVSWIDHKIHLYFERCVIISKNKKSIHKDQYKPFFKQENPFQIKKINAHKNEKKFVKKEAYIQKWLGIDYFDYLSKKISLYKKNGPEQQYFQSGTILHQFLIALENWMKISPEKSVLHDVKIENIIINQKNKLCFIDYEDPFITVINPIIFFKITDDKKIFILKNVSEIYQKNHLFSLKNSIFCLAIAMILSIISHGGETKFFNEINDEFNMSQIFMRNISRKKFHDLESAERFYKKIYMNIEFFLYSKKPYFNYPWIHIFMRDFFLQALNGTIETYEDVCVILKDIIHKKNHGGTPTHPSPRRKIQF